MVFVIFGLVFPVGFNTHKQVQARVNAPLVLNIMAGGDAEFEGNILHNITHFMDMDFIGFGDNRISGRLLEMGNPNQGLYIRVIIADGKIAGANILDSYRISGIVKNYMLRLFAGDREKLPNYQLAKLKLAGVTKEFIEELEGALNG